MPTCLCAYLLMAAYRVAPRKVTDRLLKNARVWIVVAYEARTIDNRGKKTILEK